MKIEKNTQAFVLGVVGAVLLLIAALAAVEALEAVAFVGLGLVFVSGITMLTGKK